MSAVKPIPEGYHAVTPMLVVRDAARAIEWYKQVFGAKERMRMASPDGKIAHAEITMGDSTVMLADAPPETGHAATPAGATSSVRLSLYVDHVDDVAKRAVAQGAKIVIPVADQFYGDRSGRLEDPFGQLWIIGTHIEDVSPAEMQRRMEAMARKSQSATG